MKQKSAGLVFFGILFSAVSFFNACILPDSALAATDCCASPCKEASSEEAAERYCNLSDQQQSLHATGNPLPLLARDILSSMTDQRSPLLSFLQTASKVTGPYFNNDLYLRFRILLI